VSHTTDHIFNPDGIQMNAVRKVEGRVGVEENTPTVVVASSSFHNQTKSFAIFSNEDAEL
jgi:hypothetical protein